MRMKSLLPVLFSTLVIPTTLAAQAAVVPFGTGCAWNGQTLSIGNQGVPVIGTTFQLTYSGPNWTFNFAQQIMQPHLVIGFGQSLFPIPVTFLPQQPAGCTGYISPDLIAPMSPSARTPGVYDSVVDVPVPNIPALIGFVAYAQWLTIFHQCGFAGCGTDAFLASDAAMLILG